MGIWSNGVSVLMTTSSWSTVPVFFAVKVMSPAVTVLTDGERVIGPLRPAVSLRLTATGPLEGAAVVADAAPPDDGLPDDEPTTVNAARMPRP